MNTVVLQYTSPASRRLMMKGLAAARGYRDELQKASAATRMSAERSLLAELGISGTRTAIDVGLDFLPGVARRIERAIKFGLDVSGANTEWLPDNVTPSPLARTPCKSSSYAEVWKAIPGNDLIYADPYVRVTRSTLGAGSFGRTFIKRRPQLIEIDAGHGAARTELSLIHELIHAADQLFKLGLTHNGVHELAYFMSGTGMSAIEAFRALCRSKGIS